MSTSINLISNNQNFQSLIEDNQRLKLQYKTSMEKEQMYKNTIASIKQTQHQMEENYQKSYDEFKEREAKLRNTFNRFQSTLTNDKSATEEKLYEENTFLRNKVNELMEKSHINSLSYEDKVNDYKELIKSKDKKLYELEQSIKRITKEADSETAKLSKQIQQFELKLNNYPFDNEELGYTASAYDIPQQSDQIEDLKYKNSLLQKENDNLIMQLNNKTMENNTLLEQLGKITFSANGDYSMQKTYERDELLDCKEEKNKEKDSNYCYPLSRNTRQGKLLTEYDSFENLVISNTHTSSCNNMKMPNGFNGSKSHLRQYSMYIPTAPLNNHNKNNIRKSNSNNKSKVPLSPYSIHSSCSRLDTNNNDNSTPNKSTDDLQSNSIHKLVRIQVNDKLTQIRSKIKEQS